MSEQKIHELFGPVAAAYGKEGPITFEGFLKSRLLAENIRRDDICLDIGVANGVHLLQAAQGARFAHGIDINREMLDACRKAAVDANVVNIELKLANAETIPYPDNFFDVVYSFSTIVLVENPGRAISESVRVARSGGTVILDIAGRFNLSHRYWSRFYQKQGLTKLQAFSLPEISALLKKSGLRLMEMHSMGAWNQWHQIPFTSPLAAIENHFRNSPTRPDFDYWFSRFFPALANRWYFVLRKR